MNNKIPVAIVVNEQENEQEITQNVLFLAKSMQGETLVMNLPKMQKFLKDSLPKTLTSDMIFREYQIKLLNIKKDYNQFKIDVLKDDLLPVQHRDTLLKSFLLLK